MPTIEAYGDATSDTIKIAPYHDWDIPMVKKKEAGDELEPKFPESIRNIGYVVKRPTTVRIHKLERYTNSFSDGKIFSTQWNAYCSYIVKELIVDWYDYGAEVPSQEGTPWNEARDKHLELFKIDADLPGRFFAEYLAHYMEVEKKTDEDIANS